MTTATDYDVVIGLEVHVQLSTRSKLFCGCPTVFGSAPNTRTCPVCQGMPGVLPVINRRAVEFGIKTALALNCRINAGCRFARKHYFYPDMPKNYQISQYEEPLASEGWLDLEIDGRERRIGVERLHLEEDVGKLLHEGGAFETATYSLVDFNRSGVPLMEIVSKPDLRSPEEASAYLRTLRTILVYLGVSTGNMEEGSLRCDANISLRPSGSSGFGTKVEIKNMNSFKHVQHALEFEAERQAKALASRERIVQETRLWEAAKGYTRSMRSKEYAHDYRYFPEPDLVPLEIDPAWVERLREELPELPAARRKRFVSGYGIPFHDADLLCQSRALADYYEAAVTDYPKPKVVANWVMSELLRELPGDDERAIAACPVPPRNLARLLALIDDGTISGKIAKDVFERMYRSGEDAETIVRREGLVQVADASALEGVIEQVMARNPAAVLDWQKGRKQSLGFLVGQVMKATGGKANPALVNRLLLEKLPKS
jgi:aspartyl-tRNA(Asn)/glutamyl-tRNA(Gln) amidotransferase subunit B